MQNKIKEFFNARASVWDHHERHSEKYFEVFINEYIRIFGTENILDLACGTGVITSILKSHTAGHVYGMDISNEMIRVAKSKIDDPNISFIVDDFYNTNINDIDLIVCHNAYPHFKDKDAFCDKCYNVLNRGGRLIICHSISRDDINRCHKGKEEVSTILHSVDDEIKNFTRLFKVLNKYEDDKMYLIELLKC